MNVHNGMNIIDSRDIVDRVTELELDEETLKDAIEEAEEEDKEAAQEEYDDFLAEYGDELKALQELAEEVEGFPDWNYGTPLIRDSYFTDYARDLAEDIGAISRTSEWPNDCIDWEEAADRLKSDYADIDFDGVIYWIRA
ncbi:MAG: hypothetical protein WCS33_05540 [Candidatus Caldatribacteriota bacterium]|jgi:chromosome condensin MukBEF ATPase and DNA-binding subunit MukB